jgi:hypothetical protein
VPRVSPCLPRVRRLAPRSCRLRRSAWLASRDPRWRCVCISTMRETAGPRRASPWWRCSFSSGSEQCHITDGSLRHIKSLSRDRWSSVPVCPSWPAIIADPPLTPTPPIHLSCVCVWSPRLIRVISCMPWSLASIANREEPHGFPILSTAYVIGMSAICVDRNGWNVLIRSDSASRLPYAARVDR